MEATSGTEVYPEEMVSEEVHKKFAEVIKPAKDLNALSSSSDEANDEDIDALLHELSIPRHALVQQLKFDAKQRKKQEKVEKKNLDASSSSSDEESESNFDDLLQQLSTFHKALAKQLNVKSTKGATKRRRTRRRRR